VSASKVRVGQLPADPPARHALACDFARCNRSMRGRGTALKMIWRRIAIHGSTKVGYMLERQSIHSLNQILYVHYLASKNRTAGPRTQLPSSSAHSFAKRRCFLNENDREREKKQELVFEVSGPKKKSAEINQKQKKEGNQGNQKERKRKPRGLISRPAQLLASPSYPTPPRP
jgi:hypothetical protein